MTAELQRIVGLNLRRCRAARGLSQEEFADVLEVHRTYMGSLERGERNLSLRSLERIAARIGVEPLTLLQAADGGRPEAGGGRRAPGKPRRKRGA